MKWNVIRNGNNLPTENGTYLVTIANVESGEHYRELRRTAFAQFRKRDNSYSWLYPCDHGTAHDIMRGKCEESWSYKDDDGITTDYRESIVAWAPMLAPYADDFPAICATVDKSLVHICDNGSVIGLQIGGNNHD
jgi:hypothetical protein